MSRFLVLLFWIPLAVSVSSCAKQSWQLDTQADPIPNPTGVYSMNSPASSQLRLAGRTYVAATLTDIFGASSATVVKTQILDQVSAFGGDPCDPNTQAFLGNTSTCRNGITNPQCNCRAGTTSQLPSVPAASSLRLALVVRACQQLVNDQSLMTNAIRSVRPALASLSDSAIVSGLTLPTDRELAIAYELFHIGREIPPDVSSELKGVVQASVSAGQPVLDSWRFVFDVLCESPSWQIP